ncbi:MAG: thioredoxin domain-containing protein [Microbacteriaceae bacterium]
MNATGKDRATKNERRELARETARQMREQEKKRAKRNRLFVQSGVVLGVVAIGVVISLIVLNSIRPEGPSPANMATDGIKIGQNLVAEKTPARDVGTPPSVPVEPNEDGTPSLRLYLDYNCVHCATFEAENNAQLKAWLENGAITLELHPVSILDSSSRYSTRSANAAACVANYSPDTFFDFNAAMFAARPVDGSGLSDDAILEVIKNSGVEKFEEIQSCIADGTYKNWTKRATEQVFKDTSLHYKNSFGTPTLVVNGVRYPSETLGNSKEAIAQFLNLTESNSAQQKIETEQKDEPKG